ncbi:TonB-dependent receptor [bacterium]|nr:MAG: TonB-dependent receptor [bacterium]
MIRGAALQRYYRKSVKNFCVLAIKPGRLPILPACGQAGEVFSKEKKMKTCKIKVLLLVLFISSLTLLIPINSQASDPEAPNYSLDLEKIVVTASKIEQTYKHSTQNISIITSKDFESTATDEITEVLDLLPSVDILEYGSTGSTRSVHIRGASSAQVLTLIDGRPVNTPRDGVTDFNQIPLSNIERIEVLRGPASSIYGANAVGGVINIVTKSGKEKMQTELLSKFGSFSTKHTYLTHGYKIRDFDYLLAYDYFASGGYRANSSYLSNNVNTKFGYQFNKDNRVMVSSGYYNSKVGAPGPASSPDLNDKQKAFKRYVDLTYAGKLLEGQNILLKLFHNSDRLEFIETPEPLDKTTNQTKVYGMDIQVSQTFFGIFRTAIGTSFQENRLNSSNSGEHAYNLKGAYFESEMDFFKTGSLKFGARWDKYSNFGDRISPSASCEFWLFNILKLHALAAKSFRAPTFNDLYWPREDYGFWGGVEGNPNLKPEKAISYEAGLSGYLFKKFKTDVTLFKTEFKDLIEWTVDNNWWWRPRNVSSATIKGVEVETEFLLKEHLKANFNYTYLGAKNTNTKRWLIYRPRQLYKIRLAYSPNSKFELGLSTIYKTKSFANADNTVHLKQYCVSNLNFIYRINKNAEVNFEINNIFDRMYQEERDYPMPGRAFYGGMKISF